MPIDRKRQKIVKEGVVFFREKFQDETRDRLAAPLGVDHEPPIRIANLAEGLALLAAEARLLGVDEGLAAEIVLRSCEFNREPLIEARRVMSALGYTKIAEVLKRLARTAPRRMSLKERMISVDVEKHRPAA